MFDNFKNKITLIALCFLALSFAGCVQTECAKKRYLSHRVDAGRFERDQLSILVTKVRTGRSAVLFTLVKVDEHYRDPNLRTAYRCDLFSVPSYRILMMEPGIYVIKDLKWSRSGCQYRSRNCGLVGDCVSSGAFEIKPGQIAYLGDIQVTPSEEKSTIDFSITYDTKEATRVVANKSSHWAERIEKIPFFGMGTPIRKTAEGHFKIIT